MFNLTYTFSYNLAKNSSQKSVDPSFESRKIALSNYASYMLFTQCLENRLNSLMIFWANLGLQKGFLGALLATRFEINIREIHQNVRNPFIYVPLNAFLSHCVENNGILG